MNNNSQSLKDLIQKSKSILLVFPHIINSDVCASLGLTYKLLKEKFDKEVEIVSNREIPVRFHEILKKSGIDLNNINKEIKPVSYIIRVNDTEEQVDVQYVKEKGKIDIILTPDTQSIDFDKVTFVNQGGLYDLVVTFNISRLDDLGKVYTNARKQFKKYEIVSISNQVEQDNFAKLKIINDKISTSSELLYNLYSDLGIELQNDDAEIVAHGIIGSTYGLHQVTTPKTYEIISDLANKYKVDLAKITNTYFYSQNKAGIKFRERLLENVKISEGSKIIYSSLSSNDFRELGITQKDIDGIDYLPFNICKDYDVAFLAYNDNGKSTFLIHSNNTRKNLNSIVKQFNGTGSKSYGIVTLDKDLDSAISTVLNSLGGGRGEAIKDTHSNDRKDQKSSASYLPQTTQSNQSTQYVPNQNNNSAIATSAPKEQLVQTQPAQPQTSYANPTLAPAPMPVAAQPQQSQASSPFMKAPTPVVDESAAPARTPAPGTYGFNQADKPFQSAQ